MFSSLKNKSNFYHTLFIIFVFSGFECVCRPGYTGIFCNKPVCSQGCNTTNAYCKVKDNLHEAEFKEFERRLKFKPRFKYD